jgi:hypothetical protein
MSAHAYDEALGQRSDSRIDSQQQLAGRSLVHGFGWKARLATRPADLGSGWGEGAQDGSHGQRTDETFHIRHVLLPISRE